MAASASLSEATMVLSISLVESVSSLDTLSDLEEEEEEDESFSSLAFAASLAVTLTSVTLAAAAALALIFLTGSLSSPCGVSRSLPEWSSVSTILRSLSEDSDDSLS